MSGTTILAEMLATTDDVGFNQNPTRSIDVNGAITDMNNAETVDEIRAAVSNVITAIQTSFDRFINDQRTLHNQQIETVADTSVTSTGSTTPEAIADVVREGTAPILTEATEARKALSDGILGRISDKVTSFTSSLKPILPSLQTFGIAFATTGLGAMFMTNALISAIKFIFNNPLMFIGSLIGGSILYNMFKEPIDNFITKITDKLKEWLSDILGKALTKTVENSAKTIEGIIDKFNGIVSSTTLLFSNINGSIEKLETAINTSWDKINKDINATVDAIFKTHFPEAIKKFFDIFNEEIPNSITTIIKTIDEELPKSKEYNTIINTVDNATIALNKFHALYIENKDRINKLIDNIDMVKGLTSFFKPKNSTPTIKNSNNSGTSDIIIDDVGESKTENKNASAPKSTLTTATTPIISQAPSKQLSKPLSSVISTAVGNTLSTNAVNALKAARDDFEKNGSAEIERMIADTKSAIQNNFAPFRKAVEDIKGEIADEKPKLKKIGEDIEDLSKTFNVFSNYLKLFMNSKPTESSSTNVVVNTLPINTNTEQRDSEPHDGL